MALATPPGTLNPPPVPPVAPLEPNPYADFGIDAQGNPLPSAAPPPTDPGAGLAEVQRQLAAANTKLATVDSMAEKFAVIDRLLAAVTGGQPPANEAKFKAVFEDLKAISPPGVRKALELLEKDPSALDRLAGGVQSLTTDRLVALNQRAHERVLSLAGKAGLKADTSENMNTMVFPFERAITEVINATPGLMERFTSGNLDVVDEVFKQLYAPHLSQRVKEKQRRLEPNAFPKATPRGAAPQGNEPPPKPNIHTPAGKAAFHKSAVSSWMSKIAQGNEE